MTLTRQHFQLIADAINEMNFEALYEILHENEGDEGAEGKLFVGEHFASYLNRTNINFNRDRFIKACVK